MCVCKVVHRMLCVFVKWCIKDAMCVCKVVHRMLCVCKVVHRMLCVCVWCIGCYNVGCYVCL
jgi:hypothetical protein